MAVVARSHWAELERECDRTLLAPTVQLTFGGDGDQLLHALETGGARGARPVDASEARRAFPEFGAPGDAVLEPDSAVIDAAATLDALRNTAGDALHEATRVRRVIDTGDGVRIETSAGDVDASMAVVCPGAFTPEFAFGERFATLEHVAYFRHRGGSLPEMPIFIVYGDPPIYGLPTAALNAYKLAFHHAGERVDAEHADMTPRADAVDALVGAATVWLPAFDREPVLVETCLYDNTADEDFVLDRRGNVVIGAGTSGHGFKFGPLLGELLADLATGTTPSFDLARFAADRPT